MTSFLFIIVAIAIVGLLILSWWYNSPAYKGKEHKSYGSFCVLFKTLTETFPRLLLK